MLDLRFSRLSDPAMDTMRLLAVAGNRVNHQLLVDLTTVPVAELEGHLRESIDAGVLVAERSGYAFRHALLREAVHAELLPGQRTRLHAHVAETLEAGTDLAESESAPFEIALHWLAADDHERAFGWSLRAARTRSTAYAESLQMFERVRQLWDHVGDPVAAAGSKERLLTEAARMARDAGDYEAAVELLDEALQRTADADQAGRIDRLMLRSKLTTDLLRSGAERDNDEVRHLLDVVTDPLLRAAMLEQLCRFELNTGARGIEVARQAISAAVAVGDTSLEADSRITLGSALVIVGDEDEGLEQLETAGRLAGVGFRTTIRYHLDYSDSLHLVGAYQQSVDQALSGAATAAAMGMERAMGSLLLGNAAEALLALGDWDRAASYIERSLELEPPMSHQTHLRLLRAWLTVWRGDLETADHYLAELRPLLGDEQPMPQYAAQTIRFDGEYALLTGDAGRAWSLVTQYLENRHRYDTLREYPVLAVGAWAAAVLDEHDPARRGEQIRAALANAAAIRITSVWRPIIEAELTDATDTWRAALAGAALPTAPAHLLPYVQWRLALRMAADHDRPAARELVRAGLDLATGLGAGVLVERLSALAGQLGMSSATAAGPLAGLTSRELEVLKLVAVGRSNADIGTELFISNKTASVHVSNILAKLAVSGRGEAAAIAHRNGLGG